MSNPENGSANVVYVFRGSANFRELCFSFDRDTANLPTPASGGRWKCEEVIENWKTPDNFPHACIVYDFDSHEIIQELDKNGYTLREQKRLPRPG